MFPDPARRPAQLLWLEGFLARTKPAACIREHIDRRALAMWIPPGADAVTSFAAEVRAGILGAPFALGWEGTVRALKGDAAAKRRLERVRWPAWYLDTLAVDPSAQGQGLGGELLRHGLARAGTDPVVLFTVKPSNVDFYRKFGFEVTEASMLVEGGPPAWTMRRR
ncbi:MAG: N-acetyltransferase [Pseudomonadota bacterium]|nr:N-acetyltransferase [Pseudomonadota bacterium]